MNELASRARLAKQTMTTMVRLVEREGYVERRPDPDDGRVIRAGTRPNKVGDSVRSRRESCSASTRVSWRAPWRTSNRQPPSGTRTTRRDVRSAMPAQSTSDLVVRGYPARGDRMASTTPSASSTREWPDPEAAGVCNKVNKSRRDGRVGPWVVGLQAASTLDSGSWASSAIRASPCSAWSARRAAAACTAGSSRCDGSMRAGFRAQPLAQAAMSGSAP